jgi:hypothetical protein
LILLLCAGDGDGSLTARDYRCLTLWNGKAHKGDDDGKKTPNYAATTAVRIGWWFPKPPPEIEKQVAAFRKKLEASKPHERQSLVDDALKIGHPFVLPWLDDLLYDSATRVEAAKAFLQIGGKEAVPAVVDTLVRRHDPDGDRQVGEVLDKCTGQHFGADRKKWKEWIKANTPRTPISE